MRFIQLYGYTAFLFLAMMGLCTALTSCATERVNLVPVKVPHKDYAPTSGYLKCREISGDTTICEAIHEPRRH